MIGLVKDHLQALRQDLRALTLPQRDFSPWPGTRNPASGRCGPRPPEITHPFTPKLSLSCTFLQQSMAPVITAKVSETEMERSKELKMCCQRKDLPTQGYREGIEWVTGGEVHEGLGPFRSGGAEWYPELTSAPHTHLTWQVPCISRNDMSAYKLCRPMSRTALRATADLRDLLVVPWFMTLCPFQRGVRV